jgi:hypothetical protein
MNKKIRKLLYRSFDGSLERTERDVLDAGLNQSEELAREYRELSVLRSHLADLHQSGFKPFFAERVAGRLAVRLHPEDIFYAALTRVFRRVLVAATVSILLLISLDLLTDTGGKKSGSGSLSNYSLTDMVTNAFTPSLEDIL